MYFVFVADSTETGTKDSVAPMVNKQRDIVESSYMCRLIYPYVSLFTSTIPFYKLTMVSEPVQD